MALLHHKTPAARRTIAFVSTVVVGVLLVGIMVWWYTQPREVRNNDAATQIRDFYTTVVDSAQSSFGSRNGTIEE